jgi:hypothetical protein
MYRSITHLGVIAVLTGCAFLSAVPADAAVPTPSLQTSHKSAMNLHAKADKDRVRAGENVKIQGGLNVLDAARLDGGSEPVIVQSLQGGVWVDLTTGYCQPNGIFNLTLSFSVSAQLTLRVYHPETTLYASAVSNVFAVLVL